MSDLNKQSYLIKENFYEKYNDYLNINLFKQEWVFILEKKQHIKTLWLLSYHKNYYYIRNLFNLKQTNLYKQFNFKDITNKIKNNKNYLNIYWGLLSVWSALKIWVFSLFFSGLSFYVLLVKRVGVLPQTIFFLNKCHNAFILTTFGVCFFCKKISI